MPSPRTGARIGFAMVALIAAGVIAIAGEAAQVAADQKQVLVIHSTRRDSLISEAAVAS